MVADDYDATVDAVRAGLEGDVLLVSGGVSMGEHDYVRPAFEACGVEEVFWRVRVKPGKPLFFGRRGDTLVFGLPGNPLSCIVGFVALIDLALRRLHGETAPVMRTVPARLTVAAGPSDGRATFLTSRLAPGPDGLLEATPHRAPGLAHDGRAGRERRLRGRPARQRPARGRRDRRRGATNTGASPTSASPSGPTAGAGSIGASGCSRS